jgi:hypothetical protein
MDQNNPAVTTLTDMSPALLADLEDNPALLKGIATVMAAVQLEALHRISNNPATPTGQRIQIFEATTKVAELGAYGKASQQQTTPGTGFSVNIIFDNTPKPDAASKAKTIDLVATEIVDVKDTANV